VKKKPEEPFVPVERRDTIRKEIRSLIEIRTFSSRKISACIGVGEREVY